MDGNRGAKGSIKDRLISMLYRIRYAKKVKKEEEYEVAKKEKQVEYLQKLVRLEETENIDVLDHKDKQELDKIKFTSTYMLNENNFKIAKKGISDELSSNNFKIVKKGINGGSDEIEVTYTNSLEQESTRSIKKGIALENQEINILDIVDLNLSNIEYQTTELDTKVNLKEEIKKTKNEIVILDEVSKFVIKSKQLVNEISDEVESLKQETKNKNQDTEELEKRYKKLREKVDKLKAQYDAVKEKYDLSEFSILESIKLIDNIKDYKNRASINEMDMMLKVCKKEITKIESVTIEYKETKKVGEEIEEIKEEQDIVKVKFNRSKEKVQDLRDLEQNITDELDYQEKVIDQMYKEASRIEKLTLEDFVYKGYKGMLSSMLRIAGGVLTLPFSGSKIFGVTLGNAMINRGLKMMNKSLYPFERKTTVTYHYKDIASKINFVKDKIGYTNILIEDNLIEIKSLRENFEKYKEYNKILPNYEEIMSKVDKMEINLKLQQEKISKMNKKLDEEKEINAKKIQKVMNKKLGIK